jgi:hypothetical protein
VLRDTYRRQSLTETLGHCGILATKEYGGFLEGNVPFWTRQARPRARTEVDPPVAFWSAADGVQRDAFRRFFPHPELATARLRSPG